MLKLSSNPLLQFLRAALAIAGSPWRGLGGFALRLSVASILAGAAMILAERLLQLDQPHERLIELAGTAGAGLAGLAVMAAALGLMFFKELSARRTGSPRPIEVRQGEGA